jgi:hypothetical protein
VEGGLCAQYGRQSERNRVIDRPRDACPEVGGLTSYGIVQILADWEEERYPLYAYNPSRKGARPAVARNPGATNPARRDGPFPSQRKISREGSTARASGASRTFPRGLSIFSAALVGAICLGT